MIILIIYGQNIPSSTSIPTICFFFFCNYNSLKKRLDSFLIMRKPKQTKTKTKKKKSNDGASHFHLSSCLSLCTYSSYSNSPVTCWITRNKDPMLQPRHTQYMRRVSDIKQTQTAPPCDVRRRLHRI